MLDTSLYEELTRDLDEVLKKSRKAQIGEIRRYGDSDWKKTSEGWEYVGKNKLYQVNEAFNEELQKQIEGTLPRGHKYNIGYPGQKLIDAGFPEQEIHLMATTLSIKSSKDYKSNHPFKLRELKNLPFALNHPIFVFKSKTQSTSKVVITDLKSNNVNLLVALRIDFKEKEGVVTSVRSIYPKENIGAIKEWIDSDLLVWRDKEKALKFSSKLQSNSAEVGENSRANLFQKLKQFKNPSVSDRKITLKKSLEQQFDEFLIQKARISYPIGTIKQFNVGGKMKDYIKTSNGWRPKKKGGTSQLEKEVKQDMKEIKEKAYWKPFSKEFSDKNEVADWLHKEVYKMTKSKNEFGETLDPNQTKDLVKKFQKRYEFDSYSEAEKVLKGLSFNGTKEYSMAFDTNFGQYHFYIGKRQKEELKPSNNQKIKQITQTYVKVEDGQIIVRMNKDKTRYKASKGGFKIESNEGEDIVQFKKRIKEEYEKQSKPKENEFEKEIRESIEDGTIADKVGSLLRKGRSEEELKDVVLRVYDRIRDTSFDKERDRVLKIQQKREYKDYKESEYNEAREERDKDNDLQKEVRELLQDVPEEIEGTKGMYVDLAFKQLERFHSNRDRESILSSYNGLSEENKLSLDKKLVEKGYQPIVNGLVYQNYEGNKSYKYIHKYEDALKFYKEDCSLSEEEKKLYSESWVRSGYAYINAINTGSQFDSDQLKGEKINVILDKINDEIKASKIANMIEKSSLSENLILTRYLSLNYLNKESQDLIFAKEGDVYEDLRFTAFGLSNDNELPITGDFKITLLAKKGQKVLNIGNEHEVEYLCQRGSKFRVLKTGFSSIVVELLDE